MEELKQIIEATPREGVRVRGFYRVQIMAPHSEFEVAGDSDWQENVITNLGKLNVVNLLGTSLTGSQISHIALGTGGLPATDATSLGGEVVKRAAVTAQASGSTALQLTATFASGDGFVTDERYISNVGCFGTSSGGTLLAGNTITSSSCNTNQNVNVTYTWTFS